MLAIATTSRGFATPGRAPGNRQVNPIEHRPRRKPARNRAGAARRGAAQTDATSLVVAVLAITMAAALLAGCASGAPASQATPQGTPRVSESEGAQPPPGQQPSPEYPVTVADGLKRPVTLRARPERIVSIVPAGTEILFSLGAGDRVVGVSTYCNHPAEVSQKEKVGGYSNPSIEKIASLKPDLVVGDFIHAEFADRLQDLGIPALLLNSQSVSDTLDSIHLIGRAIGAPDAAESLTSSMASRIAAVQERVGSIPADRKPRVFHALWYEPLMTSGPGTIMDDLIRLAGGVNVAADARTQYPEYSIEVLMSKNPDVIVHTGHYDPRQISVKGWANLRAVKEGKVHLLTDDLVSRPGPRIVDGLEELARVLHPELFR